MKPLDVAGVCAAVVLGYVLGVALMVKDVVARALRPEPTRLGPRTRRAP